MPRPQSLSQLSESVLPPPQRLVSVAITTIMVPTEAFSGTFYGLEDSVVLLSFWEALGSKLCWWNRDLNLLREPLDH